MSKKKENKFIATMCVLLAGIFWGTMGLLVRNMSSLGYDSFEIVMFRAIVTSLIMLIGTAIFNKNELRIKLKDIWIFIGTGIVSVAFFNYCYFSCMNYTTLSNAAILLYTAPSFVMIMSALFFRERFTLKKFICLAVAFIGCVLVSGGFSGNGLTVKGLLLGLGAGFGYALYSIFSRVGIKKGYSSITITTYTFLFTIVGLIPFVKWGHFVVNFGSNIAGVPYEMLLVIVNTVLAYILYTKGLSGMENSKASIIASIEPVVASLIGIYVFKESPTVIGMIGCALVLGSCIATNIGSNRK